MKKSLKIASIGVVALCGVIASVWAYSVDYITMAANFAPYSANVVGAAANITSQVCPGDSIPYSVTFGVGGPAGATTFPRTVTFGASTTAKPVGASDAVVSGLPTSVTFTGTGSTGTASGTIGVPTTPGIYTVRIAATGGTGGSGGITAGSGLNINFTVAADCAQPCQAESTSISVDSFCVLLHQTDTIDLKATLLDSTTVGIAGQTLHFSVDGNFVNDAVTNGSGVATISGFNVSGLAIGDHEISVSYDGVACPADPAYEASSSQGNIGVTFAAVTFQQPINADGSSVFKGGTIPVKIQVFDGTGAIVSDAEAHVFFSGDLNAIIGTDAEPLANTNGDQGNLMRWDPVAMQYIFNWDIRAVDNGTWKVWVDLGEGQCGDQHSVVLGIAKVGKGVKK